MKFTIIGLLVTTTIYAAPAPPPPPPPSAVIFSSSHMFKDSADLWQAPVNVPGDGAWLIATGTTAGSYIDCYHRYAAELVPNFSLYASPLFQLGTGQGRDEACLNNICFSCYTHWGGQPTYTYHTTTTNPGYLPAGGGVIGVRSLTGGGSGDSLYLNVSQVNRDAMQSVTMFLARSEDDPTPMQPDEINAAYFIANSADRVPVILEFHYGTGLFPAGPGLTYSATWDSGDIVVPEYNAGPLMPLGYSILGVPIPKLPTGKHTFTVKATLPGGKSYTTPSMEVFVYTQSIYVTVEGNFAPKAPVDQSAQFVPGATLSGTNLDLRTAPQMVQLNILIGRGSRGTFNVKLANVSRYPGIAMNYPPGATDTDPDIDFGGGDTELLDVPIPKGGAPKAVKLPLYIHDYAASATIEVTMPYRKTTFKAKQTIPIDEDKNGLPDAGWFVGSTKIDPAGLKSADDLDEQGVAGQAGDGLSVFEEYRGIFQMGMFTRLDPARRDLFVVPDPAIMMIPETPIARLLTIGPAVHFLDTTEVVGEDYLPRGLTFTKPVVDSNRKDSPGARLFGQRAVRIIDQQQFYPNVQRKTWAGDPATVPVYRAGIFGATIIDDENPDALADELLPQTPDKTRVVEWYEQTRVSTGIHTEFPSGPFGYVDADGQPTETCIGPGNPPNCDNFDMVHQLILPQQTGPDMWAVLHTVPTNPGDFYTLPGQRCDFPGLIFVGGFDTDNLKAQRGAVIAHEVGHAVHLAHRVDCGTMMYYRITDTAPPPKSFDSFEKQGVKLWQ